MLWFHDFVQEFDKCLNTVRTASVRHQKDSQASVFVPLSETKLPQDSSYCDQFSTALQAATPHPMPN